MKIKWVYGILLLLFLVCVKSYPAMDYVFSPGVDFFNKELGYHMGFDLNFPQKFFNSSLPNINLGLRITANYANLDQITLLNYGAAVDLGYIFNLSFMRITPSIAGGYKWVNLSDQSIAIAENNSLYVFPHLETEFRLMGGFYIGCSAGYEITFLNSKYKYIPSYISTLSCALTFNFEMGDAGNSLPKNPSPVISKTEVFQKAKKLYLSGDKTEAKKILETALADDPANNDIKEMLVLIKSSNIEIVKDN